MFKINRDWFIAIICLVLSSLSVLILKPKASIILTVCVFIILILQFFKIYKIGKVNFILKDLIKDVDDKKVLSEALSLNGTSILGINHKKDDIYKVFKDMKSVALDDNEEDTSNYLITKDDFIQHVILLNKNTGQVVFKEKPISFWVNTKVHRSLLKYPKEKIIAKIILQILENNMEEYNEKEFIKRD